MARKTLGFILLIFSLSVQASDPRTPCVWGLGQEHSGVENLTSEVSTILERSRITGTAETLCSGGLSDGQRRRCFREVERGNYYDSQAVTLCRSILNYNPRMRCIRVIRDHTFSRGVTGLCNVMLSDVNKVSCLDIGQSRVYEPSQVNMCRSKTVGFFTHDANRMHCFRELPYERTP